MCSLVTIASRSIAVLALSTVAMAQLAAGHTSGPQLLPSTNAPTVSPELPPPPRGKSTVMGGQIRDVDTVRDQFALKVFGGKSVKILFDERTQVYRDGTKISILSLDPDDQASVETTLDGTKIFALRIHMFSKLSEGECRGQVVSYDPHAGELKINVTSSHEHLTFRVPAGVPLQGVGQEASWSPQVGGPGLAPGSVVDVKFKGGRDDHGVATHVAVLAVPGSAFAISGSLSFLDLHAGRLVIVDPRDNQSYDVAFVPSQLPISRDLHEGLAVRVTTIFDGTRYVAKEITVDAE